MKKTFVWGILTTITIGLISTFFNMYTDIINLKANEKSGHETLLEIKSDVRYIKKYLIEERK